MESSILEKVNNFLKLAIKQNEPSIIIFREILSRFTTYQKSFENIKNPFNDKIAIKLINKIKKEHEETISFFKPDSANYQSEKLYLDILSELLPEPASKEEMENYAKELIEVNDKKLGKLIKLMQNKFPINSGKDISDIIKLLIND